MPTSAHPATLAIVLILAACYSGADSPSRPPNVLVIVADTLRADRLGSYGNTRGLTPFLDELATRGVVFANAYAPSSWTSPSVASLFTSRYPSQHRVVSYESVLADSELTVAEELSALGFRSAGVAGNFRLGRDAGYAQGFDSWQALIAFHRQPPPLAERKIRAERVIGEALAWLDAERAADPHARCSSISTSSSPILPSCPPSPFGAASRGRRAARSRRP